MPWRYSRNDNIFAVYCIPYHIPYPILLMSPPAIGWHFAMEYSENVLTSSITRYCKDCCFLRAYSSDDYLWRCGAPSNLLESVSVVTGQSIPKFHTCHQARESALYNSCGTAGKWFESRKEHRDNWNISRNEVSSPVSPSPSTSPSLKQRLKAAMEDI